MKRIAVLVGIVAVLVAALVMNLAILEVISLEELPRTLLRPLGVVAVSGIAIILVWLLVRAGRGD